MTESEVKEKLSQLLSQENLDYSAILSLSNRLSQFDNLIDYLNLIRAVFVSPLMLV